MVVLVVAMGIFVLMSLRKLVCKLASLVMLGGLAACCLRIWGHVLTPPMGGSASVNIMSGIVWPATMLRAAVSTSSLCVTPVCDLTLPMCVISPELSLVCMILSASWRRCLCGWCWKLRGSMAYLRIVLMLKALSMRIEMEWFSLLDSRAMAIAARSARLIVCRSSCDLISMCVMVRVLG